MGIKIKSSLQIYPTNVFHRNGGTFVGLVGLVFLLVHEQVRELLEPFELLELFEPLVQFELSNDALLLNPIYIKGTRGNSHLLRWCIDGEG